MNGPADTLDVLAMGRSCIDLYAHQIGVPVTEVTSFDAYVGGCPTNISVGTRRLGLRSALLTAVGDDQSVRAGIERYREAGATSPGIGPIPKTDFDATLRAGAVGVPTTGE